MFHSITRKIDRLRGMDSQELLYRIREKARIEMDRVRFRFGLGVEHDPQFRDLLDGHQLSIKSYLAAGPAQRFYPCASTERRENVLGFIMHYFPDWLDRAT